MDYSICEGEKNSKTKNEFVRTDEPRHAHTCGRIALRGGLFLRAEIGVYYGIVIFKLSARCGAHGRLVLFCI